MLFDTKIAVVIRADLQVWQKLNVASFLTAASRPPFRSVLVRAMRMPREQNICR
jgi:hypothetical protein